MNREGSRKKTYCEVLHVDSNFIKDYNGPNTKKIDLAVEPNVIVVNEWYRHRLGNLETQQEYDIEIENKDSCWAKLRACCHHPQVIVRVATWLAIIGLALGLIGFVLGLVPIIRGDERKTDLSVVQQIARDPRYPAHWWTPIVDPKKPDWEILPQEAGPGEVILSKRNELGLLSNFAPTPFTFHGKRYASLEGFWQMMKFPEGPGDSRAKFPGIEWKYTRAQVAQMVAFEANHAGALASENMTRMGITWVSFEGKHFEYKPAVAGEHYKLIVAATWEKVKQNPEVKKVLLATGDLILKPDHHQEPNAPAAWRYFEILTMIRSKLQHQAKR